MKTGVHCRNYLDCILILTTSTFPKVTQGFTSLTPLTVFFFGLYFWTFVNIDVLITPIRELFISLVEMKIHQKKENELKKGVCLSSLLSWGMLKPLLNISLTQKVSLDWVTHVTETASEVIMNQAR